MPKRMISLLMLFLALLSVLLIASFVAAADSGKAAGPVRNSDSEAALDGTCWFVDTMGDGCLMAARLAPDTICCTGQTDAAPEIVPVTDWPVDQVLCWEGKLLVSAGNRLLTLDPDSGKILDSLQFAQAVDRFAVSRDGLYVLSGGELLLLRDGARTPILSGVTRFWLEDSDRLCYLRDEAVIHTRSLSAGTESAAPNRVSELRDVQVPVSETQGLGLIGVRQKFPAGKYWNHMPSLGCGMEYNNQDGWTDIPCPKHNGYCGTARQSCNGYAPDGEELSYQCWGYADKLGYDVSGFDPQRHGEPDGWVKLYYKASLNDLKAGDIVRFNKYGNSTYAHSIYVTKVDGDTVTYSDCNYDGTCVIRWDQTISKSTLRSWFVFLLQAPTRAWEEPSVRLNVCAELDGTRASSAAGWAVFDVMLDGHCVAEGVSAFRRELLPGTAYEICNVRPVSGVLFDEAGAAGLSGTAEESVELVLPLDHYYLNESGEAVKTTLCDLPKQSHWSYRPICWALEQGIAGGVSATQFAPTELCSRAQIVTFLWAFAGRPTPEQTALPFEDVKKSSYYCDAVCWALEAGITAGRSETAFAPDEPCTRGEVVTFLWTLAGRPDPVSESDAEPTDCPFTDVRRKDFFYRPVLWATQTGITGGTGAQSFSPKLACSRAEILTFLLALSRQSANETPIE